MTTTHHDNASTWRDLRRPPHTEADRPLRSARDDGAQLASPEASAAARLGARIGRRHHRRLSQRGARWEAEQNLNDKMIDVPPPAGMGGLDAEHWEDDGTGTWTRGLHGTLRNIEEFDAAVYLEGVQAQDGSVAWSLYVHVEDRYNMTTGQVRDLAANLVEAADELDRITGTAPPF